MLTDRPFGSLVREDKPAKDLWGILDRHPKPLSFGAIRIKLASPQKIRDWSHGEVKKPETINYRTFKPERDGLFCARIFGPDQGLRVRLRQVQADEVRGRDLRQVRRRGHPGPGAPRAHGPHRAGLAGLATCGSSRACPARIGQLLDMSLRELEKILYFEEYVVRRSRRGAGAQEEGAAPGGPGAQAARGARPRVASRPAWARRRSGSCCAGMDMDALARELRAGMRAETSAAEAQEDRQAPEGGGGVPASRGNQPEWMILEVMPVIPPELRPLVPLDGGRFATSDLNDLYRRVINRNNRLKRLMELRAPEIIIRNEKRMLQEAVDALFDNGRRGRVDHRAQQPSAEVPVRHPQGQAGPLPPEPARQARGLLRPLGHRGGPVPQAPPVRPAQEDGPRAVQAVHPPQARGAGHRLVDQGGQEVRGEGAARGVGHPGGGHPGAPGAAEPGPHAAPARHPGLRAASWSRARPSRSTPWSAPRSTPTSTGTRWRCTCRSPWKRRWRRRC